MSHAKCYGESPIYGRILHLDFTPDMKESVHEIHLKLCIIIILKKKEDHKILFFCKNWDFSPSLVNMGLKYHPTALSCYCFDRASNKQSPCCLTNQIQEGSQRKTNHGTLIESYRPVVMVSIFTWSDLTIRGAPYAHETNLNRDRVDLCIQPRKLFYFGGEKNLQRKISEIGTLTFFVQNVTCLHRNSKSKNGDSSLSKNKDIV